MSTQTDLRRHYYVLGTSMSPAVVEQITYFLYSTRILNQYELNAISSKSEMLSKASELLSAVIRKGQKACGIFFQALETCDPHLSEQIIGKQVNSTGHTLPTSSFLRPVPSMRPHVSKPPSTAEASSSQRKVLDVTANSRTCSSSNELSASSTEAIQGETDIEIITSKLQNVTFGDRNTFTVVEELSDEDDNEEKELEEEYEENECEEKEDTEQLTEEGR
ncbi:caspase-1 isoform X2 [Heterodontus francisci]|uniref:caspase-1 isoform X2 n=1 Tax=Heterodontus francisci TaxID=7792 RepID=UPI00355AF112